MPINRPTTKTIISTQGWGIPITDEVNRLTTEDASNESRLTALEAATAKTAWANMTLQNGWTAYGAGRPPSSYRKRGDMVDIRIAVANGSDGTVITTMPAGFRPPYLVDMMGRSGGYPAFFNALTDGTIIVYIGVGGNNSLVALVYSYPIA